VSGQLRTRPEGPDRADVAVWAAAFAAFVALAWHDLYRASGDAIIHFVYALNAASGRWFQYNPGELSAGSTSVFYTTALVPLVRALGLAGALYAVCTACIAAVALILWLLVRTTRRLTGSVAWAACAALTVALNPGLAYNAPQGIEAPFFALAVAALLLRDPAWAWRRRLDGASFRIALVAALVAALRPEGVIVLGAALATLTLERQPDGRRAGLTPPLVLAGAAGAAALALSALWLRHWTGIFFPASAASRVMMARREGLHLGGLWVYPSFPVRLAAYAPLAVGPLAAAWLLRRASGRTAEVYLARVATAVLAASFVLYTFVTGAVHVARYTMFLLPLLGATAALAAQRLWTGRRGRWVVGLAGLALLGCYGVETALRLRWSAQFSSGTAAQFLAAHQDRHAGTTAWLATVGFDPARCGTMRMSSQEVQIALQHDERVQVVSTDGRIWPVGTKDLFRPDGTVDGARWIAALKPNVLHELPPDPQLAAALDACRKPAPASCALGGVEWVYRPGVPAWVDRRCLAGP
jgi:hypothetical protein